MALPVDSGAGGGSTAPAGTDASVPAPDLALARAAYTARFRGNGLVVSVAIALAETGGSGDPNAHCLNCAGVPEDSRGAWQINVLAHPQYKLDNLYDLNTCAAVAFEVSGGGTNFCPWSTYDTCNAKYPHNSRYRDYLDRAQRAVNAIHAPGQGVATPAQPNVGDPGKATPEGLPNPLAGLAALGDAVAKLSAWLGNKHNIIRVIEVVGGALLAYMGLKLLTPAVAATVAAPVKGAAKIAGVAAL